MTDKQRYIMMVVPSLPDQGGGGGGIAQVIGYLFDAWGRIEGVPPMRLVVSRGPGSIWFSPFYLLRVLAIIVLECIRGRVALVHINVASRGSTWRKMTIVAVALVCRLPVVLHLHGARYRQFTANLPDFAARMVGWMFRRSARVVVLGESWQNFVAQTFHLRRDAIRIISNGVPEHEEIGNDQENEQARLLFMGRLGRRKGIGELLDALGSGALADFKWSAVIAGDGAVPDPDRYLDDKDLAARVHFPGWLSKKQAEAALSAANIFVLPSHDEGLSIALLEAMSHGLAVIVTPVGAHGEVIENGKTGLLVPPGDSRALSDALHRLMSDPSLRRRLGRAAKERFVSDYQIERTAEKLRAVYAEVAT